MNIYFFTIKPHASDALNVRIISSLQKSGATIYSNMEGASPMFQLSQEIDGVVVLSDGKDRMIAYVAALAIARNRPILYLLEKGCPVPEEVAKLCDSKEIKKILKVSYFTPQKLGTIIKSFIETGIAASDAYKIKFTLRLNGKLHTYVKTKSKKIKMTKANYVRELIEDAMKRDETPGTRP